MAAIGNFGAGASDAIANTVGAPGDFINWSEKQLGLQPPNAKSPVGSDAIKGLMGKVGMDPRTVKPTGLVDKVARGVGEGTAGMLLPAAGAQMATKAGALGPKAAEIATGMLGDVSGGSATVGAGMGAGQVLAEEAVPDKYKEIAGMVGQVAGGAGAGLIYHLARAAMAAKGPKVPEAKADLAGKPAAKPGGSLPHSSSLAVPPAPSLPDMARASRVEKVPLSQVRGTQPKMDWEKFNAGEHPAPLLEKYADKPVAVRREDGEYLIFDGHHRAVRASENGQSALDMYVIDAKDYAPEFAGRKPQPSSPKWTQADDDLLRELGVAPESKAAPKVEAQPYEPVSVMQPADRFTPNKSMQGVIRQTTGLGVRDTERTFAALDRKVNGKPSFEQQVNALPPKEQWDIVSHVENRSKGGEIPEEIRPLADEIRKTVKLREDKLLKSKQTEDMHTIEDYFPHNMWDDEKAVKKFLGGWGGKEGSKGFTKGRSHPTISDGLEAGLKLRPDVTPLDALRMYVGNADRLIAMNEAFDIGKNQGHVKFAQYGKAPEGWVPLEGRLGTKQTPVGPLRAYAPPEVAANWNNYVSKGTTLLDKPRELSNAITGLELSFSGYHVSTMAQESIANEFTKGVSQLFTPWQQLKGVGSILKAPLAPVSLAMKGDMGRNIYLGLTPGNKESRAIVDALTEAGARFARADKSIAASSAGSFVTAYRRGALGLQFKQQLNKIAAAEGYPRKAATAAGEFIRDMGRVMDTTMEPLFQQYIPRLKNGAAMSDLGAWMHANPGASHDEIVNAGRKIVDSIDNRFGLVIQDNLFWNANVKQAAKMGMLSYSWALGTFREIPGGLAQLARHPTSISLTSKHYSPGAAYTAGLAMAIGFSNALAQYLKTGKPPETLHDLYAYRTGGTIKGNKWIKPQPERGQVPGYGKDVVEWQQMMVGDKNLSDFAYGKSSGAMKFIMDVASNKNWASKPVRDVNADAGDQIGQIVMHGIDTLTPIAATQMSDVKKGTNIMGPERFFGMRPATSQLQDPQGYHKMMDELHAKQWKDKLNFEKKRKAERY